MHHPPKALSTKPVTGTLGRAHPALMGPHLIRKSGTQSLENVCRVQQRPEEDSVESQSPPQFLPSTKIHGSPKPEIVLGGGTSLATLPISVKETLGWRGPKSMGRWQASVRNGKSGKFFLDVVQTGLKMF